jgi:hypothetical protein
MQSNSKEHAHYQEPQLLSIGVCRAGLHLCMACQAHLVQASAMCRPDLILKGSAISYFSDLLGVDVQGLPKRLTPL